MKGDSLNNIGIFSDDISIVDRSINAVDNHLIVAILEGEMIVRKLLKKGNNIYISTDRKIENGIRITKAHNFEIWGVVSHAIHKYI